MHLKKLEIQGFKSFPEYTLIEFDTGMTAVVGPNGSGKSNVTDAIRWVLGEQSVKSLRGGKMEDVIFNGTSTRKAMNYAEVTLTLDNIDRFVDYDFPEIQITRRLYRSGESEYQINKVNCRLKDITGMFLDTGLGKDGYSIVGQGRVDEILSTKSEDRRRVIEEASGIVKFKVRKDEAERKLNSTEQNLLRIDDILGELGDRIGPLEEQSKKAVEYHKTYESLKTLDISLLVHKINEAETAMGDSARVKEQLESEIKSQEDRFIKLREENSEMTDLAESTEDKIEELRQELSDLTEEEHDILSEKKVSAERINQLDSRIKESEASIEEYEADSVRLGDDYEKKLAKADEILTKANSLKEESDKLQAVRDEIISEFEDREKDKSAIRTKIEDKTNELFSTREKISTNEATLKALEERIAEISAERSESGRIFDELNEELKKADEHWRDMLKKENEVNADIEKRNKSLEENTAKLVKYNEIFEKLNGEFLAGVARLRTLKDLERRKEGYQESVRKLLSSAENDSKVKSMIVGVLGDLISVPNRYETAIEIALGNSIHNIVTETESDASNLINYLKVNKLGRVTFLPIENIRSRDINDETLRKASNAPGFIDVASELVDCSSDLKDIVSNLLGRIIICEDLDNARDIARRTSYSVKIITLDGDSVNPGGSLTGGSYRKTGVGILGRSREIEELTKKNDELEAKLADNEENRQEADDIIGTLRIENAQLSEQLKYFSMERVKGESEFRNLEAKINELKEKQKSGEETLNQISKEKLRIEDDNEELQLIANEINNTIVDFKEDMVKGEGRSKEISDNLDKIKNDIMTKSTEVQRLIAERNGILELAKHIKGEIESVKIGIENKKADIEENKAQSEEIRKAVEELDKKLEKLEDKEDTLQNEINKYIRKKSELDEKMSGFLERITSINDSINNLRNKLNAHLNKYERYINDIDFSKNRLWEDYEVTYDNVKDNVEVIEDAPGTARKISELKSKIKAIGPVNLNSIEEYREISERFEFVTNQRNDIAKAKADLEKVIADLLEEMRVQFVEHFNIINDNFKRVFFDLFGGGTAEIMLESDDVLNCAIEIKAQPPGKKLQSLTLLSGGERCLTAIALLFAILELKPSPFVILDEVEAALDDVNVSRFTDFVRRYCVKSQFILVTHRKGTMEACDRMYGVTMQERGISKILSMRLST
ncbi:MAG: chromosome segregation protein SMC [Clostridiales bacterium]|nr:chromosome segregation protein SMC [Clostridiales bacterium]